MATLLYFVQNKATVDSKTVSELGITGGNCVSQIENRGVSAGPDGSPGVIFSFMPANGKGRLSRVGYFPKKQTWQKAGAFWIGKENDAEFIPSDFERKELIAGHFAKLEDGNDYLIPCGRIFPAGTLFPQALSLGPNGEAVEKPMQRFEKLLQYGERLWNAWMVELGIEDEDGKYPELRWDESAEIAGHILAVNYNLGKIEALFLNLFTTTNVMELFKAYVDGANFVEWLKSLDDKKKIEPVSQSSDCGLQAG